MMAKYDKSVPSAYDSLYQQAADAHGVSYDLLRKLSFNESSFNPKAKSPTGPKGIMQFTRATATALGLNATDGDDDDRYDPAKAIDAGARHLSDLVRKYDGDELKAALAYNQGEGRNGAAQIQAYDKGDFSGISPEGVEYMRRLSDVAQSPRVGELQTFGGITPKGKGIPASDAFTGIGKQGSVKSGLDDSSALPESHGFNVEGIEQPAPNKPFGQSYWEAKGTTLEEAENRSTWFGFGNAVEAETSNSVAGMAFRAARQDNGFDLFKDTIMPTRWNSHVWSEEELQKIRTQVKDPHYINVVSGGSPENLDALIKMANDNYETDAKAADAGLGAQLSAGVIGAAFDPTSYIPIAGQAAKGFSLAKKALIVGAQSGAWNVASEGFRTSIAGGEAHYANAALGGFVFGAGMSALTDTVAKGLGRNDHVNDFASTMARLEARETARNTGGEDLSRMVTDGLEFKTHERSGVDYADHPTLEGSVVLPDGSILSESNILNPKTQERFSEFSDDTPRALRGASLGGFSEIGQKILRSENNTVRGIGADLVRPATLMQDGSMGKFGATASDIHERLHFTDQAIYNKYYDAMKEAMRDPEWSTGIFRTSAQGAREEISKRVVAAIERPELRADLKPGEAKVMDILKAHFDTKREMMENPAMFGDSRAKGFFPDSRHKGTYVPQVYDRTAKAVHTERFGGAEGLQQAVAESWLASYRMRPEVKTRVDEMLKETLDVQEVTEEMVRKHAMDKAYGVSHTDQFNNSSVIDDQLTDTSLTGIENNNFLEARNLFDSDVRVTAPDGQPFSVNDLRVYDMMHLMPAYDRRVNGDIAIMGSTGKTTKELKDELVALDKTVEARGPQQGDVKALKEMVKILTGRSRRDPDGALATATRAMTDLGFFAKNAYMGIQNLTEIGGMLAKGNTRALLKGIPVLRDLAYRNQVMKPQELAEIHHFMFGKELDDLIRPSRQDIVDRLRDYTDTGAKTAQAVGTFKYATQELSARSPWTKLLNSTSNYFVDAGRQGMLGEVVNSTLLGKKSKWQDPRFLNGASVSPEQFAGIQQLIKDHVVRGEDGSYKVADKRAFAADPRAMDLYRLADKVADETILRPHKVSNTDAVAYGAGVKMVMQFKNFTIRSINGRFMKGIYESTKNNRAMDTALAWSASVGLAGAYYVMAAHMKAAGMPKEQQANYLKSALNEDMITYAAFSRASHAGAPLGVFNLVGAPLGFDMGRMVRSSITPKDAQYEKPLKASRGAATSSDVMQDFYTRLVEQVPAAGFASNVAMSAYNAAHVLNAPNKYTEQDFMTSMMNTTRELVPNDPLTQQMLYQIYRQEGIELKQQARPN
ncbi:tail internal virion protein D [Pantoea phage vB_PagP-SK1]|uniref:Peptidoglycan transglycosylase gp16 n=1 Tax=Pantoea phage vB_PagP-SK1 TaxID=2653646 RepID=A0A5P8NKE7_9CAUD|nr:tail internal virion protein D [Pantoea phage vB_PagP-SK1]